MSAVKFTQLKEKFDSRKLNYIVYHSDDDAVKSVLGKQVEEKQKLKGGKAKDYSTTIKLAKKYLKYSRHGEHLTTYRQTNGKGRWFACGSLGLQEIAKPIRQTIAADFYDDVDIKNCHPTILLYLCNQNDIVCPKLKEYVIHRDDFLVSDFRSSSTMKHIYITLLNGGKKDYKDLDDEGGVSDHMRGFKDECARIHTKFSELKQSEFEKYIPIYEKKKGADKAYNVKASFANKLMEEVENNILMCMWKFFGKPSDCVYCFDGIMLRKGKNYDLRGAEAAVKKQVGIDIGLDTKPMDANAIIVPDDAPEYDYKPLRWYKDFTNIITKENKVVSELAVREWVDNTFAWINNIGEGYYIALNEGIDVLTKSKDRKYKLLDELAIKKSLKVCCNIANPRFDKHFYAEVNSMSAAKATEAKNDTRYHRVLFSRLSNYILHRREVNQLHCYDRAEFIPYLKAKHGGKAPDFGQEVFNLFQGFSLEDAEPCPDIDFTKSRVFAMIRDIMCNGMEDEFKHLNFTIADMIQDPAKVQQISHLFYSFQGSGKSLFAKFMSSLLGCENVVSIIKHDRYLYNSFNSTTSLKLLKIFEELPEKKSLDSGHSIIKGETTALDEHVEFKGKEPFIVKNFASIWSFTNFENAMYIENSDRRNVLHKCNNKHADDKVYFAPIILELENKRFIKAAFDYYATLQYNPIDVITAFDTAYKQEQKLACLPKGLKFLKTYVEDKFLTKRLHVKDFKQKDFDGTDYRISVRAIVNSFKEEGGNKATLETQLKRLGLEHSRLRVPDEGNAVEAYTLYPPDVEAKFQAFLKNKKFKFDYGSEEEAKQVEEDQKKKQDKLNEMFGLKDNIIVADGGDEDNVEPSKPSDEDNIIHIEYDDSWLDE